MQHPFLVKNIWLIRNNIPLLEPCLVNIDALSGSNAGREINTHLQNGVIIWGGSVAGCFVWSGNSVGAISLSIAFSLTFFWWGWTEFWRHFIIDGYCFDKVGFQIFFGWVVWVCRKWSGLVFSSFLEFGESVVLPFTNWIGVFTTKRRIVRGVLVYSTIGGEDEMSH